MSIIKTFDLQDFINEFHTHNRGDQFSLAALSALFDYYDEVPNFEMDVIGICCEWSELTWQECAMSYGIDLSHCFDDDERAGDVVEYMLNHTTATELTNSNILFKNL